MKRILISALALIAGGAAFAQNLNPTVEVTNIYAREATGIEKPSQLLQMPDSVLKFNLDMDYTVQSTPYQGSYEFKPYLVQLRPMPRPSTEGKLLVRAGAGYTLHPEATVVYTPVNTGNFRLNLFADHRSYIGNYNNITLQGDYYRPDGSYHAGANLRTAAGADALYSWSGGTLMGVLKYNNVFSKDLDGIGMTHHAGEAQLHLKSAPGRMLAYNVGTRICYIGAPESFHELHTLSGGSLGTRVGSSFFRVGLTAETVSQNTGYAGNVVVSPHYLLNLADMHLDVGLKLSFIFRSQEEFCPRNSGLIFPDVHFSYEAVADALILQAAVTGGDHIISYDSLLQKNPFISAFLWHTDNMVERVNVMAGVRGSLAGRFRYNLTAGYKLTQNAWSWGTEVGSGLPYMDYVDNLNTLYVNLDAGWVSEHWDVGAVVNYGYTPMPDLTGKEGLMAPAPFKANAHALYIWGGRIRGGVTVDARSAMHSPLGHVPGYADLGLMADLQMTRNLSFWLKAGNLLAQSIQRIPFYAERGPFVTVGATWNL